MIWVVVVRTTFCAILRLGFCVMCVVWQPFLRDHRLILPMFAFSRTVMPGYGWVVGMTTTRSSVMWRKKSVNLARMSNHKDVTECVLTTGW